MKIAATASVREVAFFECGILNKITNDVIQIADQKTINIILYG